MNTKRSSASRRCFLKKSTAATASALAGFSVLKHGYGANLDRIRVGLVGCGGRGTGAARDALLAGPNIELVAMADILESQIENSLTRLKRWKADSGAPLPGVNVPRSCRFTGLMLAGRIVQPLLKGSNHDILNLRQQRVR